MYELNTDTCGERESRQEIAALQKNLFDWNSAGGVQFV